jgi:thiol:disulfide interchange protein
MTRRMRLWIGLSLSQFALSASAAQERPITWSVASPSAVVRVRAGDVTGIPLVATIDTGWKLYSLTQKAGGPVATQISLGDTATFAIAGHITAPEPKEYPDRNFNIFTEIYTAATRFVVPVRAARSAKPGLHRLPILVRFQTCTDRYCLPPRTDTLDVAMTVLEPATAAATGVPSSIAAPPTEAPTAAPATPAAAPAAPARADIVAPTDLASLARFVWLAITMGLLSLLTPCILPMIPITVGYFGSGAAATARARAGAALAHALGIVGAFTVLGFSVSAFFGAGGIVRLAASPWLNLVIAALFIAFALNLLGVFEITLPQRLLAGIARTGDTRGRSAGALLMGSAFALTSFTCTVPFVGTLLVLATQGSWRWPLLGLVVYGAAFALPFFILALSPGALQRLPKSGAWMLVLKSSFAVIELALAIKFLSNVDLVLGVGVLTRDVVIGLWIVAAIAIAVICVTVSRRGRPAPWRLAGSGAAVLLAAALSLGLRGRRLGELEAYLPPPRHTVAAMSSAEAQAYIGGELPWIHNDYQGALTLASTERKPLLLDFTGYTCTNCRWMEANMFPRDDVRQLLARYVRVRLFTDGLGEPYVSQQRFQLDRFGSVALPYYAALDKDGTPVATFLGMTRDSREFAEFLKKALK